MIRILFVSIIFGYSVKYRGERDRKSFMTEKINIHPQEKSGDDHDGDPK